MYINAHCTHRRVPTHHTITTIILYYSVYRCHVGTQYRVLINVVSNTPYQLE